jgi:hypothetical protein
MMHWNLFEDELNRRRNRLYVTAYEEDPKMKLEKRASLTALVMSQEDEECMEVMAHILTNPRAGAINHIYWEDLDIPGEEKPKSNSEKHSKHNEPACNVM